LSTSLFHFLLGGGRFGARHPFAALNFFLRELVPLLRKRFGASMHGESVDCQSWISREALETTKVMGLPRLPHRCRNGDPDVPVVEEAEAKYPKLQ